MKFISPVFDIKDVPTGYFLSARLVLLSSFYYSVSYFSVQLDSLWIRVRSWVRNSSQHKNEESSLPVSGPTCMKAVNCNSIQTHTHTRAHVVGARARCRSCWGVDLGLYRGRQLRLWAAVATLRAVPLNIRRAPRRAAPPRRNLGHRVALRAIAHANTYACFIPLNLDLPLEPQITPCATIH